MPKYDGERLLIISMPSILEFQDLIVLLGISLSIPMSFQVCILDCPKLQCDHLGMIFPRFLFKTRKISTVNFSVTQVLEFNNNQMAKYV